MEDFETCPACQTEFPWEEGYQGTPGRVECPECHHDFDAEHDEEYNAALRSEAKSVSDDFDKFMGRILSEERRPDVPADSLQRLRASRHQERPLGRTRIGFAR